MSEYSSEYITHVCIYNLKKIIIIILCKKFFNENQGCYASGHGTRSENFDTKWCYVTNFFKFNTNDYSESARRLCASALIADWYKKKKNCYLQNKNVYLKEKPSEILLILGNVCLSVRPSVCHRGSKSSMLTIREILESLSWVLGKVEGDLG